ncbi:efflux RND transporter permease subunit [Treponema vincentii]|uniref:efflux RND transporter permease subunit n=1 Tax=Treponema vincentii TaxID=69710 RepID=UPI0020A56514|nr:MMPL family transporter [Treponema vincentii]UTC48392.1 MMPL family transporter [Treponema vincentii]
MKLEGMHLFFKKIAKFQLKYRWLCLALLAAVTVVGLIGVKSFKVGSMDEDEFITIRENAKKNDARFKELFGSNDSIVLLFESDDVFKPEVLKAIRDIGAELLEKVPYADTITSITDTDITVGTDEGIEVTNPFRDGIPTDPAALQEAKVFILSRKSIVNKLVTQDATETWLVLSLKATPPEEVWSKTSTKAPMYVIGEAAISVVTDPKYHSAAYTIKPAGLPYTETEEKAVMGHETTKSVGLSFLCMIILLIIFTRSLRGTIVPLVATFFAITTVLGIMGFLHITGKSEMMSVPIVLAMALSVGYSIHLVNSFKTSFYELGKRKEAVIASIENTGWPLFFTVVTTVVSVLSFLTTDLRPMRWMGAASAAMVFAVYVYVSVLIPILMSFGKDIEAGKDSANTHNAKAARAQKLDVRFERFGRTVIKRRKAIIAAFTLITAACIPALFRIDVNMDSFKFMGFRIPYIKRLYEITQSQLGSYFNYNIMLTFDEDDAVKNPDVLKKLDELSTLIGTFRLTKMNNGVPKVFSILDIVKEMNQTMHSDDPAFYTIPDDEDLLAQLLFLYEISGGQTSRWVDEEFRTLRMAIDVASYDANELAANMKTIEETCAELFPQADCHLIGAAVQFAELNNKIVFGELYSFLTSLVAIALLMMLVFGSVKMGLIGLIPNIFPVIVIGAIMGYLDISLDLMTMAIMPMILGIAVDDTIHFTNHAKYLFEKEKSYDRAIFETFYSIGKTLAMTTIILSATFLVYLTCKIDAILRLGVLAAVGLLTALAADYLMTPVLIYISKPFGKEETNG